ncbi:unnamed protein product, partial [Meganyctiphanes norvegica]
MVLDVAREDDFEVVSYYISFIVILYKRSTTPISIPTPPPTSASTTTTTIIITTATTTTTTTTMTSTTSNSTTTTNTTNTTTSNSNSGSSNGEDVFRNVVEQAVRSTRGTERGSSKRRGGRRLKPEPSSLMCDLVVLAELEELVDGVGKRGRFWIGAHNQNRTAFGWLNGSEVTVGNLPISTRSDRCLVIVYERGQGKGGLMSWACTNNKPRYICQIHGTRIPKTLNSKEATATTTEATIANTHGSWYAAGGVLMLLLLGLLAVVYLRRRRGLTTKPENITKENLVHVTTRRESTHESENSLYGAVTGPQTDTTGERGSTHDSENSMYGVVTGEQNELSNKRGSAHDSTNSLYGAVMGPEDISQQSAQ